MSIQDPIIVKVPEIPSPSIDVWICAYCGQSVTAPKSRTYQPNTTCKNHNGFVVMMGRVKGPPKVLRIEEFSDSGLYWHVHMDDEGRKVRAEMPRALAETEEDAKFLAINWYMRLFDRPCKESWISFHHDTAVPSSIDLPIPA